VYTPDPIGRDNPYPNRLPIADFDPQQHPSILLVLEYGASIPEELSVIYTAEYFAEVTVSGVGQTIWYLSHK